MRRFLPVLLLLAGCSTEEPPAAPSGPKFEGKIDASLVGEWSTPDGKSKMSLKADGTSRFATHVETGHGPATDEATDGRWLFSDGRLMIQNAGKDGAPAPPAMALTIKRPQPDRLEVQRKSPPQPIVYLRKP